jgi:hypothetical protein
LILAQIVVSAVSTKRLDRLEYLKVFRHTTSRVKFDCSKFKNKFLAALARVREKEKICECKSLVYHVAFIICS